MDNDDPPPDGLEKGLRFGCGALVGGVVMFSVLFKIVLSTGRPFWLLVSLGATVFGLAAIRFGDRIYHWLVEFIQAFLRWWW